MQLSQLIKKTLATSFLLSSFAFGNPIGDIIEHQGSGGLTRETGESFQTELGLDVLFKDSIETGRGRLKVEFIDDTRLSLTEHSEVIIDEYYYDPDPSKSKMAMNFVQGTARFATGGLGLVPKENIVITTPTATIGIRGTDFTTTVDELGRSLVILLPDQECTIDGDCSPSGEITVTNNGGSVTLTEAYQATVVSSFDTAPVQPVILENITMNIIDNMFIVSPPREVDGLGENEGQTGANDSGYGLLDFNDLDIDYLKEDWDEESLEFSELDIDLLDVDFLQDVLVTLDDVDALAERDSSGGVNIKGTNAPGFDSDTQFNTFIDQGNGQIWFYRVVNGTVSVRVPVTANATLDTTNEGKRSLITVGDGQSVVIIIRQGG